MKYDSVIIENREFDDYKYLYDNLKNGSHLIEICDPLNYHKKIFNIEEVGFEIRDQIIYLTKNGHYSIVLGRKPVKGNIVNNILEYGTGGLNIDECRVKTMDNLERPQGINKNTSTPNAPNNGWISESQDKGRFPANLIHDGSEEVESNFPHTKSGSWNGQLTGRWGGKIEHTAGKKDIELYWSGDSGSSSRFFYKAETKYELYKYLIKLITPYNGNVILLLDNIKYNNLENELNEYNLKISDLNNI